jgi:parallel beta-helix repeat protein
MKKTIAIGIVFLLVVMSFTSISGSQINNQIIKQSNRGNVLYVGGSGEGNYTTIQSAIDDAWYGDTVFVYDDSSPYYGDVVVNSPKTVNIIGENKQTTIVDGYFLIRASGVKLSGFTINKNDEYCIQIQSSDNNISGNIINSGINNIMLYPKDFDGVCNNNVISHNIINTNGNGIHIETRLRGQHCDYNIIDNNIINSKQGSSGSGDGVKIKSWENDFFQSYCEHNQVNYNIITNFRNGVYLMEHWTEDTQIIGNTFTNNYNGIYGSSNTVKIIGNTFTNNYNGINAYYGVCSVVNNIISNNSNGIYFDDTNLDITGNIITNNSNNGIYARDPSYCSVINNIVSNNSKGIYLFSGFGKSEVIGNLIENNRQLGLHFDTGSGSILQNNFINNKEHASFVVHLFDDLFFNWRGNYWGEPMSKPYVLSGQLHIFFGLIPLPWFNFDIFPAQEPNDITTKQGGDIV